MINNRITLTFLIIPFLIGITSACSCIYLPETQDKLNNAAYVFSGQINKIETSIINGETMQELTIKTIQYWKPSEFPESINLNLYALKDSGANCGYNFELHQKYIIYSYLDEESGKLMTSSCMGNSIAKDSEKEISELNILTNSSETEESYEPDQDERKNNIFAKILDWFKNLFS